MMNRTNIALTSEIFLSYLQIIGEILCMRTKHKCAKGSLYS